MDFKKLLKKFGIDNDLLAKVKNKEIIELTKEKLEGYLMLNKSFNYNPALTATLCKVFDLDWDKITDFWLHVNAIK